MWLHRACVLKDFNVILVVSIIYTNIYMHTCTYTQHTYNEYTCIHTHTLSFSDENTRNSPWCLREGFF